MRLPGPGGVIAACIGLLLAFIGSDPVSGVLRFTPNSADLPGGIKAILVMAGLFAVTEKCWCRFSSVRNSETASAGIKGWAPAAAADRPA